MRLFDLAVVVALVVALASDGHAQDVLVEAESFASHGGWKLDTQFIDEMGSPYLLAHGLGSPLDDATTTVEFPETGTYHVFVRTKDWVARWSATGQPGRFQLLVDDKPLQETFGTRGAKWFWHDGGQVEITSKSAKIALHDLTGFDGRCDAVFFTRSGDVPPNESNILSDWRLAQLGLDAKPTQKGPYDLVVIGGGYAGMGAAISGARMGCRVALIQNRPVLGGNGSSEVRVWAKGNIRRGKFPRIGEIIEEFCDHAVKSPGTKEEFGDELKEQIIHAEGNIDLFLNHHAYAAKRDSNRLESVTAFDTRTSEHFEFTGTLFSDCTGHGTIGALAGADLDMEDKGRMGMSNMWAWAELEQEAKYPDTSWALDLEMEDFPYPRDHHGQWFWESGFDQDPLSDAEGIRDHNLRAVYGAFNAMKNRDGADQHRNAILTWVAYIGGPRESRRLMGDVVLNQDDVVSKRQFPDGCVPSTWSIDLHYPKKQYAEKFPDNPFISYAVHGKGVDRSYGYPVPYRCFYSRNIENLFMAGRNISVTHQALGTTRVMKTCGMMGEVVGRAASICILHECNPRHVYDRYLEELIDLLHLPGKARRKTVYDTMTIPDDAMELASAKGPMPGLNPKKMEGLVIDDTSAEIKGEWGSGAGLRGFVGYGYLYSGRKDASVTFRFKAPADGRYDIRVAYANHENRGSTVPVSVSVSGAVETQQINMKKPAPLENGFISLGIFDLTQNEEGYVKISANGAGGNAHADAIQIVAVK
ncbi:MAG: FAD-dependent oxidoreductase [Fuerstiella sp.]|nr:FAD-dependent oxidoreductase [Fuerstiella sp.]MCP4857580.1 FAD-dependent oxidoreductase [Fuerstiella sp.]